MTHNQTILLRHWSLCYKRLDRFSEKVLTPKVQMLSKKTSAKAAEMTFLFLSNHILQRISTLKSNEEE